MTRSFLGNHPKVGGQSRMTCNSYICRFMKNIIRVSNFYDEIKLQ